MKKIILLLGAIIFLSCRMPTLAAASCRGRSDCPTGYECVYWDNSGTPRIDSSNNAENAFCAKIYQEVTRVPTKTPPTPKYAKEGEFCGAGPNGVIQCEPGLKCDESRNRINEDRSEEISGERVGAGGICVKITPIVKPTIIDDCRLKICGDANCDGKLDTMDRLAWVRERLRPGVKTTDFNKDGKVDTKDYALLTSGIQGKCQPIIAPITKTPVPTNKPTKTPIDTKICNTDNDCLSSEYCYQPPMPTCPKGQNCLDVMPQKYCRARTMATPLPTTYCRGGYYGGTYGPTCGSSNFDLYNYYLKFSCADNTSGVVGDTTLETCYNKNDLVNMAEKFCSTHSVCSTPTPTAARITMMPTSRLTPTRAPTIVPTLETKKYCESDADCSRMETCYQPPMPTCPPGENCIQVMPQKYCKPMVVSEVTGVVTIVGCKPNKGDANRDGKINLTDYALWRFEYAKGLAAKADFNCDKRVDTTDYKIWKETFLETKGLMVTGEN
ncbi:MAG TPA: hypothetical protein PK045_02700 [Candidatus Woesebacteria bacterium]|nr:hypothetical protein [Candidatus Woesebacteria bacterium]